MTDHVHQPIRQFMPRKLPRGKPSSWTNFATGGAATTPVPVNWLRR